MESNINSCLVMLKNISIEFQISSVPQKRCDLIAFMEHSSIFMLGAPKLFAASWTLKTHKEKWHKEIKLKYYYSKSSKNHYGKKGQTVLIGNYEAQQCTFPC